VHYIVKGRGLDPNKVERAVNMTAEKYCSVSIMLSASVELTHDYEIVEEQE
jgi:putative redox protein